MITRRPTSAAEHISHSYVRYADWKTKLFMDRLPPIPTEKMTPPQRAAAEEVAAGRRGELYGPFVPALRSPEFMRRLQRLGEYLRYDRALPPRVHELVILIVARAWNQHYEWHVHVAGARHAGLDETVIAALAAGRRPDHLEAGEALAYDFFVELQRDRHVSDDTYERAVLQFGEQGVIDLIGTIGYYSMLAMIMNVAQTPAPATMPPLEPPAGA